MDIDRWIAGNAPTWDRLGELVRRAGPRGRRLGPDELAELTALYQRVSTHLSQASTTYGDAAVTGRLSLLVSQAGALVYGSRPRTLRGLARFFTTTLPAALWCTRRALAVSAALTFVPAIALGVWLAHSPRAVDATGPAALRQAYVDHDFESYYRSAPSAEFAAKVYTNNVEVSFAVFATGILIVPAALILVDNGANLGEAGGLFAAAGRQSSFWGSVTPHGLIELTSVVIAGGAGLSLGWALVAPGDRSRRRAVGEAGRRAVVLVLGTVLTLAAAGLIEGFVTGSSLPTWARVGVGVVVEVGFVTYAVGCGRAASRAGWTGALGEGGAGWVRPPSGAGRGDLSPPLRAVPTPSP